MPETGISHSKPYNNTNNSSVFLHYDEFEHIIFKNMILPSKIQIRTATHHLKFNNTEILPLLIENSTIQQFDKSIDQLYSINIQNEHKPLEFYYSHTNLLIIAIVIVLFLMLEVALSCTFCLMSRIIKVLEHENRNISH